MLRGAEKLVPVEYWCPYGIPIAIQQDSVNNEQSVVHVSQMYQTNLSNNLNFYKFCFLRVVFQLINNS